MAARKESNINDYAFDYLRSFYMQRYGLEQVMLDRAQKTKHGHQTDGLFSFNRQSNDLFIASLHTSQSATITHLLLRYKKKGLSKVRYVTLLLVLAVSLFLAWESGHWAIRFVLPAVLGCAAFLFHTLLEEKYLRLKLCAFLDSMKKTPADEQWLGLSISSLAFRNNPLGKFFLKTCHQRGIGIITVGKRSKVILLQEPKTIVCRRGDFLSHYSAEARIRKAVLGDSYLRVA
ncbi:hypothetical protein [Pontibacter akesuensis]|uniref:Uncharacterized protein n=1 Tax=Pontibacter akesuensis TaxID=388950 RepID=A0A1I7JWV8_9BACT|nr:hypothetical protein [Pontibacter akesuensis]GHA76995.1 hypothetical protein GCM10007389_33770 [Pontibacter akesuensis]SFU89664.1 hypothetical protein SAMN04487941_3128 [Pontibacter akesuensis]